MPAYYPGQQPVRRGWLGCPTLLAKREGAVVLAAYDLLARFASSLRPSRSLCGSEASKNSLLPLVLTVHMDAAQSRLMGTSRSPVAHICLLLSVAHICLLSA